MLIIANALHSRFAYIVRLFGSGKAHVLWFEHAAKSSLNELAHPQELLLLDHCDVIEVDTIIGKCNNRWLSPEEEEPLRVDPLSFFYRCAYPNIHVNSF